MNELEKILNEPEAPKLIESIIPIVLVKQTPAANRANLIAEQDKTIASASIGSHIYRSTATFLADSLEFKVLK